MLRAVLLLLVLANLLVLAWNRGLLAPWLPVPGEAEREPERAKRQVNPELVSVLSPGAASAAIASARRASEAASQAAAGASSPASAAGGGPAASAAQLSSGPASCLEAGPLAAPEVAAAEKALREKGPAGLKWTVATTQRKGNYLIYMGRFPDEEAVARKVDELRRLKVETRPMANWPDLQPGLVLGRHDDKAAADAALGALAQRGVRTARVVTVTPAVTLSMLRVAAADADTRSALEAIRLPPGQIAFGACAAEPARN